MKHVRKRKSRLTLSRSGDVTEESVGISFVCISDSCVELKIFVELLRCGLGSLDSSFTNSTSVSIELTKTFDATFKFL